jgi:hypothetical protein
MLARALCPGRVNHATCVKGYGPDDVQSLVLQTPKKSVATKTIELMVVARGKGQDAHRVVRPAKKKKEGRSI